MSDTNEDKIKQLLMSEDSRNLGIELAGQFLGWSVVECVEYCIVEFYKQTFQSQTEKSILFNFDWCNFYFDIEACFDCKMRFQYKVARIDECEQRHVVDFYYKIDHAKKLLFKQLEKHIKCYAEKTN